MVAEQYQRGVKFSLADYARDALHLESKRKEQICKDLLIPDALRLSKSERCLIIKLFKRIIIAVENELRLYLIEALEDFAPISLIMILNDPTQHLILAWLSESSLLQDVSFVTLLIRRVREYFLRKNFSKIQNNFSKEFDIIDELIAQSASDIALPAMALLIAENRRLDHFDDSALSRTDLPAELQYKLLWWVAACLRPLLLEFQISENQTDIALSLAVKRVLSHYDEGDTLDARALKLARNLHQYRKLSDQLILRSAAGGHIALLVATLAIRAGVSHYYVWDIILEKDGSPLLLLLKAIGMKRQDAFTLTFNLIKRDYDECQLSEKINAFDSLSESEADETLTLWRLDECYREAICETDIQYNKARREKLRTVNSSSFQRDCL